VRFRSDFAVAGRTTVLKPKNSERSAPCTSSMPRRARSSATGDAHGHDAGDHVVCETARRLLTIVRGADTVARVGGDEFVIVFQRNDANSHDLIPRLDRGLSEPIKISPTTIVTCPASIDIADTRTVGYNGAALLAAADDAMYDVKRKQQVQREDQHARKRRKVV
jgi:diguanylate cyclase (GGDEF)-like protein